MKLKEKVQKKELMKKEINVRKNCNKPMMNFLKPKDKNNKIMKKKLKT